MALTNVLVGLVILVGLVGVVIPVLPGSSLVLGAVLVWALLAGTPTGWVVFSVAAVILVSGAVVKYALPGRGLRSAGVPRRALVVGGLLGIVGFFVLPVIGLVVGFVLGVYLEEVHRLGADRAWPSTTAALRAVGLSLLIELAAALLAALTWGVGAIIA